MRVMGGLGPGKNSNQSRETTYWAIERGGRDRERGREKERER